MRLLKLIGFIAVLSVVTSCDIQKTRKPDHDGDAETAGPQFAKLCIARNDWPHLLATMKTFGAEHHLEMHGGIENDSPYGPTLNVYLAQGYSYYFGDDFDLWFVSDPFRKNVVDFGGVLKRKPITPEQQALAMGLLTELSSFSRRASGPINDPTCG